MPSGDHSHPKTGSLHFVCSAWKMAVLEAKSTPVRFHPPKQGPGLRAGRGWGLRQPEFPLPGLMLNLEGGPPRPCAHQSTGSKSPGAR